MPSRIIREGIITSVSVNALSERGELFYRRLMSVADDHGRYYAHPSLLRAACFPLKLDAYNDRDLSKMLDECVDVGLVRLFNGKKCLEVLNFRQQARSDTKFPEVEQNELLSKCSSNDKQLLATVPAPPYPNTNTTPNPNKGGMGGIPPERSEVDLLFAKTGLPSSEAEKFWNHYGSNGWRVGRNKMTSLTHAVAGWASRYREKGHQNGNYTRPETPEEQNRRLARCGGVAGASQRSPEKLEVGPENGTGSPFVVTARRSVPGVVPPSGDAGTGGAAQADSSR